ncbi:hypothetical protein RHMOL_Rhmol07G0030500 [Rhododendron molle]|uniref:Uncharacterized protein n=1 Tax=Rhododendron molle TaxID=49168 RepID=A0ACC0MXE3_RHOML|nr:hypothetical protein RHMOL_Rhmol07G0030500 [Rhododendron molle]
MSYSNLGEKDVRECWIDGSTSKALKIPEDRRKAPSKQEEEKTFGAEIAEILLLFVVLVNVIKAYLAFESLRLGGFEPSDKCVALILTAYETKNKLNKALDLLMELERDVTGLVVLEEDRGVGDLKLQASDEGKMVSFCLQPVNFFDIYYQRHERCSASPRFPVPPSSSFSVFSIKSGTGNARRVWKLGKPPLFAALVGYKDSKASPAAKGPESEGSESEASEGLSSRGFCSINAMNVKRPTRNR